MIDRTKTSKRLGIVGAAAAVGLVPVSFLATPAFAAVSNASLSVSPTTTASTSQVINSFTTGTALPAGDTITINSLASSGCIIGLPDAAGDTTISTTGTPTDYTVTFTPSGGTATTETGTVVVTPGATCNKTAYPANQDGKAVVITVNTPIPANSSVTVTANKAYNPPIASGVYFQDFTQTDTQAIDTNVVSIGNATVSNPSVTSVNPTAYTDAGGEPFTVTGTNFSTTYNAVGTPSPVVCFVESTTTPPTVSSTAPATNPCAASVTNTNGVITSAPATNTAVSSGEIQGTSPQLTAGHSYNVVVYNYNGGATTPTYTPASGTNSQTLVGVATGLDVVPQSGIRVVDSRSGLNLPQGALTPGSPVAIQLSNFNSTLTLPTNLPAAYTGLDLNVTAVAPVSGGNIQIYNEPANTACPNGLTAGNIQPATVNFQPPQDTNNSQLVPITNSGNAGELCVQDNGAAVNVVIDLVGYTTGAYPVSNTRVLDTRPATQVGSLQGPLQANTVYRAQVCAFAKTATLPACGASTTPVAFNIADVAPSAPGNLRVFPEPASGPVSASNVPNAAVDNYIVNTDASAMLVTNVTPDINGNGYLDIYSAMANTGTVNVVIDDLGSYTGKSLHTVAQPYRIYDSRPGPIPAAGTVTVAGAPSGSGTNFTPGTALGLVGNLSDINPAGQGFLVTFPAGGTVPGTASIAHFPLQTRNTNNLVALNPTNGSFSIYNAGAATNTTFDVSAYIG